jgi:hypothetical protein
LQYRREIDLPNGLDQGAAIRGVARYSELGCIQGGVLPETNG